MTIKYKDMSEAERQQSDMEFWSKAMRRGLRIPENYSPKPTTVVHCNNDECDVYIGRPSIWGNPFSEKDGDSRAEVIRKYKDWLLNDPEAEDVRQLLPTLEGKVLGCWCKPKACHGDVLAELADNKVLEFMG